MEIITTELTFSLTTKEIEVLRLMSFGYTNKQIATSLFCSKKTIEGNINTIHDKLSEIRGNRNKRVSAVLYYLKYHA